MPKIAQSAASSVVGEMRACYQTPPKNKETQRSCWKTLAPGHHSPRNAAACRQQPQAFPGCVRDAGSSPSSPRGLLLTLGHAAASLGPPASFHGLNMHMTKPSRRDEAPISIVCLVPPRYNPCCTSPGVCRAPAGAAGAFIFIFFFPNLKGKAQRCASHSPSGLCNITASPRRCALGAVWGRRGPVAPHGRLQHPRGPGTAPWLL